MSFGFFLPMLFVFFPSFAEQRSETEGALPVASGLVPVVGPCMRPLYTDITKIILVIREIIKVVPPRGSAF